MRLTAPLTFLLSLALTYRLFLLHSGRPVAVVVTLPLARFTDWLVARERDRRYAGAVRASGQAGRRGRLGLGA